MNDKQLRIAFMGTPDFSVSALAALDASGYDVVCAYTQPPRPKGRGHQVQPSPVHSYADDHGITVYHPQSLKSETEQEKFAALNIDVSVVVAYGLILPQIILDAPKYGCINIHASLLPRWRGASPIQRAILAGDDETGITLIQMNAEIDTGPIITAKSIKIGDQTTLTSLHDNLAALGAKMIVETIDTLADKEHLESTAQNDDEATKAPLLEKSDGVVKWEKNAVEIDRQIRALNPWPGVWCQTGAKRIKIIESAPESEETGEPAGTILDLNGLVACGSNSIIKLLKLQPPDKKPMDFISALNGGYINIGDRFS